MEKTPLEHALDVSKSIFIQACAGAGKTFALTKRYAAILDDFARKAADGTPFEQLDQNRILVITFTKKAAGEMIDRINKDIGILLAGKEITEMKSQDIDFCPALRNENEPRVREYKNRLKESFSQNAISTIDSFCSKLIREFAHKINLDPQFTLQEDSEAQRLFDESLEKWLKRELQNSSRVFDLLLEELNFEQIRRAIRTLYGSREVLDEYTRNIKEKSPDEIWQDWLERYLPDADVVGLADTFEALWEKAQSNCKDSGDGLYRMLEAFYREYSTLDRDNIPEFKAAFLNMIRSSGFITRKNKDYKYKERTPGNKKNWKDNKNAAERWFELLKTISIHDLVQSPGPQDKKIIPLLKELISLFERFNGFYSDIKTDRNILDFSDVIIKTHELLSSDLSVREQVGKRYCHIMLDEFQDTNPMRWEIVKMIFEAGTDNKIFIVGDRKQSIYRFNQADVTVMNEAEKLVKRIDGKILDFNDNYRSSELFVKEGINPLVSRILPARKEAREAYEADFEPTKHKIDKENIAPALEMHWCDIPDEKDDHNYSALHAAKEVRRLLETYKDSPINREGKPLIGVLFRKFTNIGDYLQVFRRFNIPIEIVGGKGFYKTAPALDIYNFLSVLDNPFDDHALTGLLRSPFIGLADPVIHRLSARKENDISLFEIMADDPELKTSRELISSWIKDAGSLPLDELISGILDNDYRELGYVSELLPQQQLANLDKAINIIRGMQRKGNSLREIREFFYFQAKNETPEAQAPCSGTAKVHLLTVHKAKGLEYPIVVLPEMNSRGNVSKENIRFGRSGGRAEISLSLYDQELPGLLQKLKEIGDKEEEAEDKRIFYVALTRAVYKVCFLGEGKNKCEKNTWWHKYILKPCGLTNKDDKPLDPGDWPGELISRIAYEILQTGTIKKEHAVKEWQEIIPKDAEGAYLYRSPHDLMGDDSIYASGEADPVPGMALGSLYHLCIERNWFDISEHRKDLEALPEAQMPEAVQKDLFERTGNLLEITKKSPIYHILQNQDIEKYHELPLKGWLKKNNDIVQVNGTIDLLFCENGQWVVLDFKTDSSKNRLHAYRRQLITYQWMLKQAFGIDAAARLFFVALNEIVDVQGDDAYFNNLPIGPGFRPTLPDSHLEAGALFSGIKSDRNLLFCASAYHEEQVYLALVNSGKMRPDITVTTLNKWLASFSDKGISRDRLRLMIRSYDPKIKPGTADYLAKAFRESELKRGEILPEFKRVYAEMIKKKGYCAADQAYAKADINGAGIAFIDMPPPDSPEKELIEKLRLKNDCFNCSLLPANPGKEYGLIRAFSPQEEVLAVAQDILDHFGKDDDILITVSSMEKYAPHLKRFFPQMGLEPRFSDTKPLSEYPLSAVILNLIKLSGIAEPVWTDLAAILLHPLMKPASELLKYDKITRSMPWEEIPMPSAAKEFLKKYHCRKADELHQKTADFISDYQLKNICGENKLCDKILQLLQEVVNDFNDIYRDYKISLLYQELKTRIDKSGMPRRDRANGIPVVGFLDSLGAVPNKLYVMGVVEGDIPRAERENPCLRSKGKRSLELNRHFIKYWKALGSRVVFSSALHAEDGSEQSPSVFLRELNTREITYPGIGRRAALLKYDNCLIKGSDHHIIRRHNEITGNGSDVFLGRVNATQKEFHLSVTSVDTLLACPMRFYFDNVLKLKVTDEDERKYRAMKKGSVIHKAFEYFTVKKGFTLPPDAGTELLKECLYRVFREENIDIEDPFQADHFRDYIRDLHAGSETNSLVKLLAEIHEKFEEYREVLAEKPFSDFSRKYGDIFVYLNGRIDKIMIDEAGKKLIASDYKTGSVTLSRLSKMMLSQLYLYVQQCKEDYPGYRIRAAYDFIRDKKNTKIVVFSEKDGVFRQENSRNGNAFGSDEFEAYLKRLFIQISEGKYYITERPFNDACHNCSHEGLCRKNTRMRAGL